MMESKFPHRDYVIHKVYKERLVEYNPSLFSAIDKSGINRKAIRRFKLSNLKPKCALYDGKLFQVGVVANAIYDCISNKMYIKAVMYFGNKSNS